MIIHQAGRLKPRAEGFCWSQEHGRRLEADFLSVLASVHSLEGCGTRRSLAGEGATIRERAAVVLVVGAEALQQKDYRDLIAKCVLEMSRRPHFRLIVLVAEGESKEELDSHLGCGTSDAKRTWAEILDSVQLSTWATCEQVLTLHLSRYRALQFRYHFDRCAVWTRTALGFLAICLNAAAVVILGFAAIWLKVRPDAPLPILSARHVALAGGALHPPLLLVFLFYVLRFRSMARLMDSRKHRWQGTLVVAPIWINGIVFSWTGVAIWFLAGLGIGTVLEALRRGRRSARRAHIPVTIDETGLRNALESRSVRRALDGVPALTALNSRILPPGRSKVFLSYTRRSSWVHSQIMTIQSRLDPERDDLFVDTKVDQGTGWRPRINKELRLCDRFVVIADSESVEQRWPTAELIAALRCRQLTGSPEILVLTSPDLSMGSRAYPVWGEVLRRGEVPDLHEGSVRVVQMDRIAT